MTNKRIGVDIRSIYMNLLHHNCNVEYMKEKNGFTIIKMNDGLRSSWNYIFRLL